MIRTFEEEKEYYELTRKIVLTPVDEEEQIRQNRIAELEKKEMNEEYYFQKNLEDYELKGLTLRQLQEKYIEDIETLDDEWLYDYNQLKEEKNSIIDNLENSYETEDIYIEELEDTTNYYENKIKNLNNKIDTLYFFLFLSIFILIITILCCKRNNNK